MPLVSASYRHFSAPKSGDTPLQQFNEYKDYLENSNELADYIYMDRAWPEARFYEKYRRNNDNLSFSQCLEFESNFIDFAKERNYSPSMYIVHKPWSFIEKFHINELLNNREIAEESALLNSESLDLNQRKKEHEEYYLFMFEYMKERMKMYPDISSYFPMNITTIFNLDFSLL